MATSVVAHFVRIRAKSARTANKLPFMLKEIYQFFGSHVVRRTGVKTSVRTKFLCNLPAQRLSGVGFFRPHHHLHHFVTMNLFHPDIITGKCGGKTLIWRNSGKKVKHLSDDQPKDIPSRHRPVAATVHRVVPIISQHKKLVLTALEERLPPVSKGKRHRRQILLVHLVPIHV